MTPEEIQQIWTEVRRVCSNIVLHCQNFELHACETRTKATITKTDELIWKILGYARSMDSINNPEHDTLRVELCIKNAQSISVDFLQSSFKIKDKFMKDEISDELCVLLDLLSLIQA